MAEQPVIVKLWRWNRRPSPLQVKAELKAILARVNAFESGQAPTDYWGSFRALWDFVCKYADRVTEPGVAVSLVEATRSTILLATASEDWERVAGACMLLAPALGQVALSLEQGQNMRRPPVSYLTRLRGVVDEGLYGMHRAQSLTGIARASDLITATSYTARQFIQASGPENLAEMLTERNARDYVEKRIPRTSPVDAPTGENYLELDKSSWASMVRVADKARRLPVDEMFLHAFATGSFTPLAARCAQRDIIYLICGSRGGAAVRFSREADAGHPPASIELPGWDISTVRRLGSTADSIFASAHERGRRSVANDLHHVLEEIGKLAMEPLLDNWPNLERVALVPTGECQHLPFATAQVAGRQWAALVDTTIAPNAQSLLVAALQSVTGDTLTTVMGDAGAGSQYLDCIAAEIQAVAAVYEQAPDSLTATSSRSGSTDDAVATKLRIVRESLSENTSAQPTPTRLLDQICSATTIHLACHGLIPPGGHDQPRLFLAGQLNTAELELRRLRTGATIVLSACSVGGSIRETPLEVLGFPAMLLSIGARVVIASQWPVEDASETVALMACLHRMLQAGSEPSLALAYACEAAEAAGVPCTVWGGFTTYGA